MYNKLSKITTRLFTNLIFKNSFWGIIAQFSQSLFAALFFIIIAREYGTREFADYAVANVLYTLVAAFSALGLNQWFVREISNTSDKADLMNRFFKIQLILGFIFYGVNVLFAFITYTDPYIHYLAIFLGVNIVFDNLINAVKNVNVAMFEQKKTFIILTLEALLKFLTSCVLFIHPFSVGTLTIILLAVRFLSLNLFLTFGSSNLISIKGLYRYKIHVKDSIRLIATNWPFIVIGGVAMVNWRISTIIISKFLLPADVANYEISYKLFSMAQILPVIVSYTVFPMLIRIYFEGDMVKFKQLYRKIHIYYLLLGLLSYTFIYAFGDYLIPMLFGKTYLNNSMYSKQMFLTILVFPTAFLQANMLVAMKLERLDMWFNVILLGINVCLCLVGLHFIKSLTAINIASLVGFLFFHIFQDIALFKRGVANLKNILEYYIITFITMAAFLFASKILNPILLFCIYWIVALFVIGSKKTNGKRNFFKLKTSGTHAG